MDMRPLCQNLKTGQTFWSGNGRKIRNGKPMIERILRFLPVNLRCKIEQRRGLTNILNNIIWLFFDKFIRLGVGLLVGVWIARYLGPEQFGLMSYVIAFVSLFAAISSCGFSTGIIVRDLVQNPSEVDKTMGTALALQVLCGIFAFGFAILTINYIRPDDNQVQTMVACLAALMIPQATNVIRYWFEAQVQSKYIVWTENGVFLFFAAVKIVLICTQAALMAFIWTLFAEGMSVAIGFIIVYSMRGGRIRTWLIRINRAKILLKDSWPLILAGVAYMVYMRIDQIMLGQMLGNEAVGIYTSAVKISEVWYFIPIAFASSIFPSIIDAKKKSQTLYYERLQQLFNLMVMLSLAVALPMTFISYWVVDLLFGDAYHQAGAVLAVHIWAGIFSFLQAAVGKWFLLEGLQKYSFYRMLSGAVLNVVLNLILIPKFGIIGAAWATLASMACSCMFFNILSKKTRPVFFMQCRSFNVIGNFTKILSWNKG
jgi:O-antigen/teichoic acid export membrane protein